MSAEIDAPLGAISINEFADRFKLSRVTIYKQVKQRRLRLTKVGTRTIILLRDVLEWERSLQKKGGTNAA